MPFPERKKVANVSFICKLTGEACKLVEKTQKDFNKKFFPKYKRMELGKARAVQILLDEYAEQKNKDSKWV